MKGFDSRFIDELKSKNDLVSVAEKYMRLEQRGGNFWGCCPFHHEKTPSFTINSMKQFYYCFGCHKSGDVISFIMEMESLDFNDAVKFFAERVHMPLPEIKIDDEKIKEQKRKKERSLALLRDTALFYVNNLRSSDADKHYEYMVKRGLDKDGVTKFGVGASLDFNTLPKYLLSKGYTEEEMISSGAVGKSKSGSLYDELGGRLIIPIINQFGQVVAFGGRLLEKADFAKYKNTRETSVFSKSKTLYNLVNVKKLKNEKGLDGIIIVEGYMDTISLVQAGFENVVASMGTSLTKDQARILKRYTEKVYISYDGDFAGQKAAIRGLEILKEEGLEVKVVSLPDGLDPDDVIKKFGASGYKDLLINAMPLIDFKLDIIKKTFDLKSVDGRRKYVTSALKVIKESESPAEQEDLLMTVRKETGYTLEALKRELYGIEVAKPIVNTEITKGFKEAGEDKAIVAARFILSSYLDAKPYALETDLESVEFTLPAHNTVKEYLLDKKKKGEPPRFNDVFELLGDEDDEEKSKLAQMDESVAIDSMFDRAKYFADCLKTLKSAVIDKDIERVKALLQLETETEKRRLYTKELSELLIKKNKINK